MMWGHSLLVFFFSVAVQQEALDCETRKRMKEFPPPSLESKMKTVMKGQHVSLSCSNKNKSLQVTYSLFRNKTHLKTQNRTGEPMVVNLTISEAYDLGPYKCKAQVSSCSKYSRVFNFTFVSGDSSAKGCPLCLQLLLPGLLLVLIIIILMLAFWIIPKYKSNEASVPGLESKQCVSTAPHETRHSQEIYATPVFQEVALGNTVTGNECKNVPVYSELNF
ncbi:allergin-1 isoform X2 [Erinaceus europaeus]|uniref:Allergin-1 isoform X2 n=1 Tax=Erinaceus europaeus TaxID=9365 RepID=A0ABM3YBX2_ERIEU|nr:allergin-1 isoform X2 [Erinaceus europaeus]